LHFGVRVRSGLAAAGQSHESKYLSAIFPRISRQIRMSSPSTPPKST
jgi:hypothetical protein